MSAEIVGTKRSFAMMNAALTSPASNYSNNTPAVSRPMSSRASSIPIGIRSPIQRMSQTSSPTNNTRLVQRSFDPDTSILLVGARGTGKSTLGVIAATAFRRRLIDTDHAFEEATGQSASDYRKLYGLSEYYKREMEVLEAIMSNNSTKSIIVCGRVSLTREGQSRIAQYGRIHPVVLILRDVKSVQSYLKAPDIDKVVELFAVTEKMFRTCSNLEFFNSSDTAAQPVSPTPYLALKKAERHFIKFLTLATNISNAPPIEDAYPLSRVRVDERTYTYAVSVPLTKILSTGLDIERIEEGADVFEVRIDATGMTYHLSENKNLTDI
jgi:shikimate kinase